MTINADYKDPNDQRQANNIGVAKSIRGNKVAIDLLKVCERMAATLGYTGETLPLGSDLELMRSVVVALAAARGGQS